ncbi:hypothetical protein VSDG_03206 [Cytospora chrysosperma]|uniref:J domain-containing protein n=1 Tax=Cytospora chrysosperma TaxID=252740 RepID=A0A423WBK6_CYTCH|nr:hypothetical protein VSDG_03206 [Valsa sordida]
MTTNRMAYDALQAAMARQRVTVYDLYGLLHVSPSVDEAGIRRAYDAIARKLHPEAPSNINVAYSILVNPFKRAQYDRDRLEYLYKHFNTHESFPAVTASLPTRSLTSRDEQIQVYATTLVDRVKDPIEEKKKAIIRRIATIRNEVDEFNELSLKQRQDWATSSNHVLRMAGNALCEVVVCAEEDLRMLEDELGRVDGVLEPRDKDGPAGRVTSGQYGSEISSMNMLKGRPRVLMDQRIPSVPRSPTVPIHPKSASKLGVQGQDISGMNKNDTPSSEGSEAVAEVRSGDRVDEYLLGPTNAHLHHQDTTNITDDTSSTSSTEKQKQPPQASMSSLVEPITKANSQAKLGVDFSSNGTPMGLVDYQRLHGLRNVGENLEGDNSTRAAHQSTQRQYNLNHKKSSANLHMSRPPIPATESWHSSWDSTHVQGNVAPAHSSGFHALRGSTTASNTALFKEAQDRAASAARAPGRWIVGGPGLTNYKESSGRYKKDELNDPFLEKDGQGDAAYEHLSVGSYKRRLSTSPQSSRSGAESSWAGELEHPLSLSTSLSASTCALTALHSGSVTNTGTGITTPDRSDMRGYHSAHRMSENPRLDEVSNKLRRSYHVDSEVEEQHGECPDHGSQTSFSGSFSKVSHSWMPQMMEAGPVGVNADDVFAEMDLQSPWAPSSPISLLRFSDEESSDGSQHKTRLETEAVDSLGIITQVPGALIAAPIITSENNNIHTIDMPKLLKTSNRLLEDGRRLLAGGKRQPRPKRAHKFMDHEPGRKVKQATDQRPQDPSNK